MAQQKRAGAGGAGARRQLLGFAGAGRTPPPYWCLRCLRATKRLQCYAHHPPPRRAAFPTDMPPAFAACAALPRTACHLLPHLLDEGALCRRLRARFRTGQGSGLTHLLYCHASPLHGRMEEDASPYITTLHSTMAGKATFSPLLTLTQMYVSCSYKC